LPIRGRPKVRGGLLLGGGPAGIKYRNCTRHWGSQWGERKNRKSVKRAGGKKKEGTIGPGTKKVKAGKENRGENVHGKSEKKPKKKTEPDAKGKGV